MTSKMKQLEKLNIMHSMEEKLKATDFVVEATNFERWVLCNKHREEVLWVDDLGGVLPTIATVKIGNINYPVTISLFWAEIDHRVVMFYTATSIVVDYNLIKKWLRENIPAAKNKNKYEWHTDAQNFHICLSLIKKKPLNIGNGIY